MPDFQKYKLQTDRLGSKVMLHTSFDVPAGINQNSHMNLRLINLLLPKLLVVRMAQVEQ